MTRRIYELETLNKLSKECHQMAIDKGFRDGRRTIGHYMMLAFGEFHEAIKADHLGKWAKITPEQIYELRVLEGVAFNQAFLRMVKGTVQDKIADAVIRLFDLLGCVLGDNTLSHKEIYAELYAYSSYVGGIKTLSDALWPILRDTCDLYNKYAFRYAILCAIKYLEQLCNDFGIDMMTHIQLKMKYNEARPCIHRNKY